MHKRVVALLLAGSLSGAALATPAVAPAKTVTAHAARSCSSGYKHAVINGAEKCLRAGEFCSAGSNSQYHRYGYDCHRQGGYYRLRSN